MTQEEVEWMNRIITVVKGYERANCPLGPIRLNLESDFSGSFIFSHYNGDSDHIRFDSLQDAMVKWDQAFNCGNNGYGDY